MFGLGYGVSKVAISVFRKGWIRTVLFFKGCCNLPESGSGQPGFASLIERLLGIPRYLLARS